MQRTAGFVALLTTLVVTFPARTQDKPILAVMEIEDKTGKFKRKDLEAATEVLSALLAASGKYAVVDKSRQAEKRTAVMRRLRRESYAPCYDDKCKVELGRELAADTLLSCVIVGLGKQCTFACNALLLEKAVVEEAVALEFGCRTEEFYAVLRTATIAVQKKRPPGEPGAEATGLFTNYSGMELDERVEREIYGAQRMRNARKAREQDAVRAWSRVKNAIFDDDITKKSRIELTTEFLRAFPEDNPHGHEAEKHLALLLGRTAGISYWGAAFVFGAHLGGPPGIQLEIARFRHPYFQWTVFNGHVYWTQISGGYQSNGIGLIGFGPKLSFGPNDAGEIGLQVFPISYCYGDISEEPDFLGFVRTQVHLRLNLERMHFEIGVSFPLVWFYNADETGGERDWYRGFPFIFYMGGGR